MLEAKKPAAQKLSISFDLRIVSIILLLVIIGMLVAWRPWSASTSTSRTVQVTGEATVKAEPDNYMFYPSYEFKNADRQASIAASSKKTDEIVAKLKNLGVADKNIKVAASGYNDYKPLSIDSPDVTYTATLTITVDSREQAQKVQDYLLTTDPSGTITPQATFSESKRKELEATARDEATKDARKKAEQNATNLGFKIGKVKEISDGQGFSSIPYEGGRGFAVQDSMAMATSTIGVQPGENELRYSVTVTYFIR